ncbi:hypothetical protein KDA11_06780 [Candidatus Saccharibacteria bacterium]|nr:hypothetical protein [Candidatus Saccharibacteria bacterium]
MTNWKQLAKQKYDETVRRIQQSGKSQAEQDELIKAATLRHMDAQLVEDTNGRYVPEYSSQDMYDMLDNL